MKSQDASSHSPDAVEREAAEWVLRQDRGLSAAEQDQLSQWLAADARHGCAIAEHRWGWDELDRLAGLQSSVRARPDPHLLAPTRRRAGPPPKRVLFSTVRVMLAAATVAAAGVFFWPIPFLPIASTPPVALLAPCEQRTLADGSVVELNRGAAITVRFTATQRHVRLDRGEAHFSVVKDAERPFVVDAGGIAVRAVGTAFSVSLEPNAIAVLVTQGSVHVDSGANAAATLFTAPPLLEAGQRAVVSFTARTLTPVIANVSPAEIEERLSWKPRLLDFNEVPLAEIAAEFNRHNPAKLILADTSLGKRRLSASFRSDNVEGFVRLMESDFGMVAEWPSRTEIVLRKAK